MLHMHRTSEIEASAVAGALRREWSRLALVAAAVVAVTVSPGARACEYAASSLTIDSTKTGAPPGPIANVTLTVQRGRGPTGSCGRMQSTSCDGSGTVALHFTAAADPDNGVTEVGYRMALVSGAPPAGLDGLTALQVGYFESGKDREATVWLHWDDGATDDQEDIDFTVTLTPVDAQGNEGPTSAPIRIHDSGGGGCAVGHGHGRGGTVATLSALGVLILAAFRRRLVPEAGR